MECRAIRSVCYALVVALVSMLLPAMPARAQLMPTYSVAIVDFVNESGVMGNYLARIATDAVQVEMSKTSRYDVSVISRTQIKDEMDRLDIHPPLDKVNLVRLGEALTADAVLEGAVKSVQVTGSGPTRTSERHHRRRVDRPGFGRVRQRRGTDGTYPALAWATRLTTMR